MSSVKAEETSNAASFEDALAKTSFGKFNYLVILICGNIFMAWFYEVLGFGYYLPVAECDLQITSKVEYGIITGFAFAGIIASCHFWGFLADMKGRKKILLISLSISLIFNVLSSLSKSLWMFAVWRFFNGFFVSTSSTITFAYLGEFHNSDKRSKAIMIASSIYGGIGILLPLCAYLIVNQEWKFYIPLIDIVFKPWRLFVLFCGLPTLISVLCLLWLPESPKFLYTIGKDAKALKILKRIHKMNTGHDEYSVEKIVDSEFGVTSEKSCRYYLSQMWEQTRILFSKFYLRITIIMCFMQFGASSFIAGMLVFFPKILHDTATFVNLNLDENSLTVCGIQEFLKQTPSNSSENVFVQCIDKMDISAFGYPMITEALYMTGFFIIGMLVNVLGIWPLSNAVFAICGVSAIALVFCTDPMISKILYIAMLLCGLNSNMVGTATADFYPTNLRSTAVGLSFVFGRVGSIIGINVIGYLFDYYCSSTFLVNAVACTICVVVPLFLPKTAKTLEKVEKNLA